MSLSEPLIGCAWTVREKRIISSVIRIGPRRKRGLASFGGNVLGVHPQFCFGLSDYAKYSPRRRSFQPTHGRSRTMTTKLITANMEENLPLTTLNKTEGEEVSLDCFVRFRNALLRMSTQPY